MTRHDQIDEELLEEAMDWFLRLREPSRSSSDEQDFTAWIRRSPLHQAAWTKACRTWEVMGETSPVNMPEWQNLRQPRYARPRGIGRRMIIGAGLAALAACLIAIVVGPTILMRSQADYMTATAQVRRVTLEDGTIVDLSATSAIAVDFSDDGRRVKILSGEAFFDVKPDPSRPFIVNVGGELDITVVGTAFDVNVTPQLATVQLAHGAVDLSAPKNGARMKLRPGDFASLDRDSGHLSKSSVDVDAIASWRDGKLFVQDVPISSVVATLQRYHPAWITVASGELGARRVTGLYDLSDPDRALEALVSPYGASVHHVSPYLRVLSLF
ncbi:transmembrane sensor [Neorhizobium huautlense]|uniref:Transmembrane sensor n=1 Tax=Neorhizobium huautlense TaxID=67774 RepID=A0ABT9PQ05_9HYPH|nr:FecR family protein [Neorhizobium huautlense]MDP9836552.1 transmembrane sensor [Neorhizobium huautlense]